MEQTLLDIAANTWGMHPRDWPMPPHKRPRFWQTRAAKDFNDLERVFGYLSNEALYRFYSEAAKGQSVYEDAGGYMLRCYKAMIGEDVDPHQSYRDAVEIALKESLNG